MINILAQSSPNHPAAFRLASNLNTVWLGSTCQGYNPRRYSIQGHGGTQACPPRQGSNKRGVFFVFFIYLFIYLFMFLFFNPAWILDPFSVALGSGTPYISSWFALCLVLPLWVILIWEIRQLWVCAASTTTFSANVSARESMFFACASLCAAVFLATTADYL